LLIWNDGQGWKIAIRAPNVVASLGPQEHDA
jgi:hypothetical protein